MSINLFSGVKFFLFVFLASFSLSLHGETANILLLHSYHEGFKWTDDIDAAIQSRLKESRPEIQFFVEYMDSKRLAPADLYPHLEELYQFKYGDQSLDLIICSDNNALDFLKTYRDKLFGPVPVVFCGVNNFTSNQLDGFSMVTGVTESTDLPGTIDLILKLQPKITTLAAISDTVPTGKLHAKEFRDLASAYSDSIEMISMAEFSLDKLESELSRLPKNAAVIYLSYFNDGAGNVFSGEEAVRTVLRLTDKPVYSLWDWTVGLGTVGGLVISGEKQGIEAADMAISLLDGLSAEDIPILRKSPNMPLFDYEVLSGIYGALTGLPPGSVFINRPVSFFEQNKTIVYLVSNLILVLVLLIFTLLYDQFLRKKMAGALEEQKNILKSTIDHIPLFVYWKNKTGRVIGGNLPFYQRYYPGSEAEKGDILFSSSEKELISSLEEKALEGQKQILFHEALLEDREGKLCDYVISVIPFSDSDSPISRIIILQDISQRRQLERQLKQSQKLEALGRLAGGVAHDFNNLLTGIIGASDLLSKNDISSEERADYFDMINESCLQAEGLVRQLLSYSRKAPIDYEVIGVNDLLLKTNKILERTIRKSIITKIETTEDELYLRGDRSLLQSSLINLGVNGADAMGMGGVLTIRSECIPSTMVPVNEDFIPLKGDHLRLTVSDTGDGIDPAIIDDLFDPFFTTKEAGRGTGLGLAGVYGCIKSHKGIITVQSKLHKGSVFSIYLPLIKPSNMLNTPG